MKECPLCKLAAGDIKTKLYYQDKLIIIVDCLTCGIPMVVLKEHKMNANNFELGHMEMTAKEIFGKDIKFRKTQRQVKNHLHWHIVRANV